jgi:hypothetical protein
MGRCRGADGSGGARKTYPGISTPVLLDLAFPHDAPLYEAHCVVAVLDCGQSFGGELGMRRGARTAMGRKNDDFLSTTRTCTAFSFVSCTMTPKTPLFNAYLVEGMCASQTRNFRFLRGVGMQEAVTAHTTQFLLLLLLHALPTCPA